MLPTVGIQEEDTHVARTVLKSALPVNGSVHDRDKKCNTSDLASATIKHVLTCVCTISVLPWYSNYVTKSTLYDPRVAEARVFENV